MYIIEFLTYLIPTEFPHRRAYMPAFVSDIDSVQDVTSVDGVSDPNVVVWGGTISAATLDLWLSDPEIYILFYEAVDEPV